MKEAGDAFCKAADMATKAGEQDDAGQRFHDASKAYKLSHPERAIMALRKNIEILLDKGRFRQAADRMKEIAQIYQADGENEQSMRHAMESFVQSGEWQKLDDYNIAATTMFKEAADLAALLGEYQLAVKYYEDVADHSLGSPLTKYSVREYFFKATLCHLCQDIVGARRALEDYRMKDASFEQQREYKFLVNLVQVVEDRDEQAFANLVRDYDQYSGRLDNWKVTLLTRIKQTLEAPTEEGGLS